MMEALRQRVFSEFHRTFPLPQGMHKLQYIMRRACKHISRTAQVYGETRVISLCQEDGSETDYEYPGSTNFTTALACTHMRQHLNDGGMDHFCPVVGLWRDFAGYVVVVLAAPVLPNAISGFLVLEQLSLIHLPDAGGRGGGRGGGSCGGVRLFG